MSGEPTERDTDEPCPKHRAKGVNPGCPDCDHNYEPTERDVEALRDAVLGVYRRHNVQLPLNHVNVVEWVDAVSPVLAERMAQARREGAADAIEAKASEADRAKQDGYLFLRSGGDRMPWDDVATWLRTAALRGDA